MRSSVKGRPRTLIPPTTVDVVKRPYHAGDEASILPLLNRVFEGQWGDLDLWHWKHRARPGFSGGDVHVYVAGEQVVGCVHQAFRTLRLEPGVELLCGMGGDLAVDAEYRRHGLMMRAHDGELVRLHEFAAPLALGYTTQELHDKVYRKNFGHSFLPTTTRVCRKILSTRQLCRQLESYGTRFAASRHPRRALRGPPLKIDLRVSGFDPCCLSFREGTASCVAGEVRDADLRIALPYEVLSGWRNGWLRGVLVTLRAAINGQLRTQGAWRLAGRLAHAWHTAPESTTLPAPLPGRGAVTEVHAPRV